MKTIALTTVVLCVLVAAVRGDCGMTEPRGSNNKLNGQARATQNQQRLFDSQNNANTGHHWGPKLNYYLTSEMIVEWQNQHGCGNNPKTHCEIIIQYMCEATLRDGDATAGADGRQTYDENQADNSADNLQRGRHETGDYYNNCKARERNKGLFAADQNVRNDRGATSTRQDRDGTQHGTECPEERDYYPYWHPTPWKDIAILTNNVSRCDWYREYSGNVMDYGECDDPQYNNQADCEDNSATWTVGGSHGLDPPECKVAPWSRVNHNGNTLNGQTQTYNFTLGPGHFPQAYENCAFRIRYNMSTDDTENEELAFWDLDHRFNGEENSPVIQDPLVDIGIGFELQLALNTDQYGRTFQDRSHTVGLVERASNIPENAKIHNIGVRGRRGNIVQAYPSTEYDFSPKRLHVNPGDFVHWQWTGTDYGANNQDGEGTSGTDRHNVMQIVENDLARNYPAHIDDVTMIDPNDPDFTTIVEGLAFSGGTGDLLNDSPASYDAGLIQMNQEGVFNYMCTRNNNFSNRSQKGTIIVGEQTSSFFSSATGIALIAGGGLAALAAGIVGLAWYARANPASKVGQAFAKAGGKV